MKNNKQIIFCISFLASLFIVGCTPKPVHHQLIEKEKAPLQQPLPAISPLFLPTYQTSKSVEEYEEEKIIERQRQLILANVEGKELKRRLAELDRKKQEIQNLRKIDQDKIVQLKKEQSIIPLTGSKENPPLKSPLFALLTADWNRNALKYIAVDGYRYSFEDILDFSSISFGDSIFFLKKNGDLLIGLEHGFTVEIVYYPPNTQDHQHFKPFDLLIMNRKQQVTQRKRIDNRLEIYTINH
ncbi:MAG: hypothetical protein GY786_10050 [Proteobacteria bacterium]|nr:hypothetical protein [Pseudomonadota bacterium]